MAKLRIMSTNVWRCAENKPWWIERGLDCSSASRAPGIVKAYSETLPDIIGTQECDVIFREHLPKEIAKAGLNYTFVEAGFTSFIYNNDKLELVENEYVIYPESHPEHEGVFNNDNSKSFCLAVFRVKEDGKYIVFAGTHLWWMSGDEGHPSYRPHSHEAREYQMNMMIDHLEKFRQKYNCPAVAVGDINAKYDSLAIKAALTRGYRHAHDIAVEYADERNGWHYCFPDGYVEYEPTPFKEGIDHILVGGEPEGFVKRFERYTPDYYVSLSDHYPVFADVEF